jgi:MFS family permease
MLNLGLKDEQIGLLASIGMVLQVFTAMFSGAITDKMGRRKATFIFDVVAWSIPTLILAFAQNFYYFLAAAVFASAWRITMNSWSCLMVEDAEKEQLVHIWTWVSISGLIVGFISPLSELLVNRFSLIPTVRALYIFAFLMMTIKFVVLYIFSTETTQGNIRMQETHGQPMSSLLAGYPLVFRKILHTPRTLVTLGIMIVMSIAWMIGGTFWPILATEKLHIPEGAIARFPFIRSVIMLMFFFLVIPRLGKLRFTRPMLLGYATLLVSAVLLVKIPAQNMPLLVLNVILDACSAALISPLMDSLVVLSVDPQERARIMAILYMIVIIATSPFGWIAGRLSEINRVLPFYINIVLYTLGAVLVIAAHRLTPPQEADSA